VLKLLIDEILQTRPFGSVGGKAIIKEGNIPSMGRPSGHLESPGHIRSIYCSYRPEFDTSPGFATSFTHTFSIVIFKIVNCTYRSLLRTNSPPYHVETRFPSLSGEIPASGDITKLWEIGP
jgi:hypothetical protein